MAFPSLLSPTIVGESGRIVCLTGLVNLFQFIQAPRPGDIIGTLTTAAGLQVGLRQTRSILGSQTTLAGVDRRIATVCGTLTLVGGQPVLDVAFVSLVPFAPPVPFVPPRFRVVCQLVP